MGRRHEMYQVKTVRTPRAAQKLIRAGWEVVANASSGTWFWGQRTSMTLRRLNPKYKGTIADVESMTEGENGVAITGRFRQSKGGKR